MFILINIPLFKSFIPIFPLRPSLTFHFVEFWSLSPETASNKMTLATSAIISLPSTFFIVDTA